VLVTEGEPVVLTEVCPKEIDEALALMKEARKADRSFVSNCRLLVLLCQCVVERCLDVEIHRVEKRQLAVVPIQ